MNSLCDRMKKKRKDGRTEHLLKTITIEDSGYTKWKQINIKTKDGYESITDYMIASDKIDLQCRATIWSCRNIPTLISTFQ